MNIGIFFHKDSTEMNELANKLFKILYRDYDNPSENALMIDTHFIKINESINLKKFKYSLYIFLVDDYLVLSRITNIDEENSFVVSFSDFVGNSDFNTKKVYLANKKENIEIGLFTFLASKLYRKKRLSLFLSHTKRGKIGFEIAKEYNTFIQNNTKLNSFIDINDISYGEKIKEEIKKSLNKKNTIFIGFNTDLYSNSKWTQYEVLMAKKKNVPIIIIECFENKLDRTFPYFGNCLTLHNQSMENNIVEILKESIRLKINKIKMKYYSNLYNWKNISLLNTVPELLDLQNIGIKKGKFIIYPEPPITDTELKILKKSGKNFFTPLTYICNDRLNKKIGISISEVNGIFDNGFENIHLKTIQEEIAKYLLYSKNKIVYGGDINYDEKFNFVRILADIADKYRFRNKSIINYSLHPLFNNIPVNIKAEYKNLIDFIDYDKNQDFALNLSLMREEMAKVCDARIMIAGKHFGYSSNYPGLLEEAYFTLKERKPLYLVGGFGGISKLIIDLIKGKDVKELTFDWQKEHRDNEKFRNLLEDGISVDYDEIINTIKNTKLNNLSDEDNEILFYSSSIEEIIFYIMKGLNDA